MDTDLNVTDSEEIIETVAEAPADDSIRASLDEAFKEAEVETKPRDEAGKFKAKDATENVADVTEEVAKIERLSPKSLKKELADKHWSTLDPELQDALIQRDDDFAKGIEGYKTKAERGDAYERAVTPYLATIQGLGIQPEQAITELLKSDHTLRHGNEQQKLAMVQGLFQAYGINPQSVFNYLQNGAPQVNPEIAPVYQELQQLRQQQQALMNEQKTREQATLSSEIDRAKAGKEHWDLVTDDMAALLQANRATDLDQAYDMAIWARPDLRASLLQQERKTAEAEATQKAQAQRSHAAASSVRGSSPSASTSQPTNLRDMIANQF